VVELYLDGAAPPRHHNTTTILAGDARVGVVGAADDLGGTDMQRTNTPKRDAEEMARRQMEMVRHGWGERAADGLDLAFKGQLVGTQSEIAKLMLKTMSEQIRQNAEFALDLMGTRGPERVMQCQNQYWSDTMARIQRFQNDLLAITQQASRSEGDGGR